MKYVLDACALIAFLSDEKGANKVGNLLYQSESGVTTLLIHNINLLEINYE